MSSGRLTTEDLAWVDEKMKDPNWARTYLESCGLMSPDGTWSEIYWPKGKIVTHPD